MRKRQRAGRPKAGQEEMWLRVPGDAPAPEDAASPAASRSEEPAYEDPWYEVLRRRLGERAASE